APPARPPAEAESADDQPGAGEDADGDRPDVGRGEEVPDGPAVIAGQRAETDGEREELRDTDDGCTHRRECEAPVEQRHEGGPRVHRGPEDQQRKQHAADRDRKSTRLNSSHDQISYAVFCLKKKKKKKTKTTRT